MTQESMTSIERIKRHLTYLLDSLQKSFCSDGFIVDQRLHIREIQILLESLEAQISGKMLSTDTIQSIPTSLELTLTISNKQQQPIKLSVPLDGNITLNLNQITEESLYGVRTTS